MAWMHPRCREGWKDGVGDRTHSLEAASKPFLANKSILCDQNLPHFDAVVSLVATVLSTKKALHQLDVACRKFLHAVVGHGRGTQLFIIGIERCNKAHWNMV